MYGIQYQPFSRRITMGRLNKTETRFLDQEDHTEHAVASAALYVLNVHQGHLRIGTRDGPVSITVTTVGHHSETLDAP